jgi:hypothetical protein
MTVPYAELLALGWMMPDLPAAGSQTRHAVRKAWSVPRLVDLIGRIRHAFPGVSWGTRHNFCRESALILMARIHHAPMVLKTSWDRWFRMQQQEQVERKMLGLPSR